MRLRLQNLSHRYQSPDERERQVLDIPEWSVEAGQQILIRGVSGSGKTTLFNISAGLMAPTTGAVLYDDLPLYVLPEAQRDRFRAANIGYIFQTHYLLNTLTALENVVMPMAFAGGTHRRQREDRAAELLIQVGLDDHLHYYPSQLSTGQRMRVAVVRALANKPAVVLADEPTASLDAESGGVVMDIIRATCQQNNAVLLVSSHDPALYARFDAIVHLRNGRLEQEQAQ